MTLSGDELKQVRSALQGYLSPEMVTKYVWKMDEEVRRHIDLNWVGHKTIKVLTLCFFSFFGLIFFEFYILMYIKTTFMLCIYMYMCGTFVIIGRTVGEEAHL